MVGLTSLLVLALPTPPTLLRLPPLTVVVLRLLAGADAVLRLPPEELVLALERLVELLLRLVLALERLVELLLRLVLALERLLELLLRELLAGLLMVPPTALDVDDELRDTLLLDEELPRDDEDDDDERDVDVWLELERLLPPPRDWALTGDIASAIAATAASASLNVVFIMLNFSVRKYKYSILHLHNSYHNYFLPKDGSMREGRKAVTATVARQQIITSTKNPA